MQENKSGTHRSTGTQRMVAAGELRLWTEEFGNPGDPAVLLLMGAGAQGVQWNDGFVERLVAGGRRVVRYDHRDTGLSSTVDFATHPYTVADMADDALAVLDGLGVERAHLVGASLGGVIAQRIAVTHPHRVLTLTALSSSPLWADAPGAIQRAMAGAPPLPGDLPAPSPELLAALAATLPREGADLEEYLTTRMPLWRLLHGGTLPFDEDEYRAMESLVYARARSLPAALHHSLAGSAGTGGTAGPAAVKAPTLVLHGTDDPMFPLAHGEAVAAAVPDARLVVVAGMGHTLPSVLDARLAEEVLRHTAP
ncbi:MULTISPECIES: alpha/beta fold hydrolase [Streptomyces]|uniref:Hydrolase n=2 Tax=Streptomyces TaxID=1883 RepID=A0A124ECZ5_9ACTN|nr:MULTISPECIES: alpha/beta hydrolase [Streptomyces]KUH39183.1 hydrolase [Streptomyces kanasensis]UUS33776.1 alpha/beta fold hydrolase [Streptomyces changanensis]